ncbi:MAG: PAS domain S-box protein [Bacteroidetes bacterium]|nr:PAS domain S-box protein [Bacteroidota bacterium]
MEVEKKFVNTFCFVAVLCSFALTGFKIISGVTPQYYLTLITTVVATTTYFINLKYSRLAFFLIKIPGLLVIYLFDDGVSSNAGYFLYYFPYILLSFLYGKSNKNILYYIDIFIILAIFFLVNFTDIPPKLGLQIPKPQNHNLYLLNLCISIFLSLYLLNLFLNNVIKSKREGNSNEAKLLTLIGSSSNLIWSVDKEYRLTSANDTVISTYEKHYKRKIVIGENTLEGLPKEDYNFWKINYEKALKGEVHKFEQKYIVSTGIRILEYTLTPIRENKVITGVFVTSNDITASKQYENEILEREKNLSLIIKSFDDILIEVDKNCKVINVWHNDETILSDYLKSIIGKNIIDFNYKGIGALFNDLIDKVLTTGGSIKYEFEFTVNRHQNWYVANISLVPDTDSNISIKMEEITIRKNNELETIRQKEFLNQLINNLPVGIFAKDVTDNFKYTIWNDELEKMFGLLHKDVIGKTDFDIFKINDEFDDFVDTDSFVIDSKEPLVIDKLNVNTPYGKIIAKTIKIPIFSKDGKAEQVIGILENITEIKKVQDELINAEKRWNYALTGSRDGIWDLNLLTNEMYYSPVFKKMLGYEENEFENTTDEWENHVHPKDIQEALNEFRSHVSGLTSFYQTEYRIRCKDGNYTWVLDRGKIAEYNNERKPIRFIGTITDINHLKELEEKSKNNEALLRSINQNITEAIYRSTTNKGLVYINKSFVDMFGFNSYEEAIKTPIQELYDSHQDRDIVINELLEQKTIHNKEVLLRKKNGETFWGLISTICIENENGNCYFDGAIRDISSIKQIEEQLIQAKEMAEAAAKAKGLFLSTMSHEIRTPMNAVIGIANLLLNENPSKEQLESLQTLKFSAESLMYLINDILDFSKIDAGKIELESTEFNLAQLLVNIKQSFQNRAEEKGLRLNLMIDPQMPQVLIGDPVRVAQIITNLISNAIKFTENGTVTVEASVNEITPENSAIYFKISDTGIGISLEKIPYIFDHFIQASSDTTRKYGGTGLGLAITKKLIELFNSQIYIDSQVGIGTQFHFTLKFINSHQLNQIVEPKKQINTEPLTGIKLLLVEDNDVNTFVVGRFLKNWDVSFDVAQNGVIAIDMHRKSKYDLILMDLQMPVMDGYEATMAIRLKDKKIPIIALTANAFSDIKQKVLDVGMNDYITKPFDPDDLYKKIKNCKVEKKTDYLRLF